MTLALGGSQKMAGTKVCSLGTAGINLEKLT